MNAYIRKPRNSDVHAGREECFHMVLSGGEKVLYAILAYIGLTLFETVFDPGT